MGFRIYIWTHELYCVGAVVLVHAPRNHRPYNYKHKKKASTGLYSPVHLMCVRDFRCVCVCERERERD